MPLLSGSTTKRAWGLVMTAVRALPRVRGQERIRKCFFCPSKSVASFGLEGAMVRVCRECAEVMVLRVLLDGDPIDLAVRTRNKLCGGKR